jgi:hypothetical protein
MNNTTHFVHLQPLPLQGFRYQLAVMSSYKPQTRGCLGLTLDDMSLPLPCRSGLCTCFATRLCLRLTFSHTVTQHSISTLLLNLKDMVSPQKGRSLLGLDQTRLLPPEAGLNLNPSSYQSEEQGSQIGSRAFPGSFVQTELTFSAHRERGFRLSD